MGHWTPTGVEPKDYDDDEGKLHKLVTTTHAPRVLGTFVYFCTSNQIIRFTKKLYTAKSKRPNYCKKSARIYEVKHSQH